jgi:hypothetical protein
MMNLTRGPPGLMWYNMRYIEEIIIHYSDSSFGNSAIIKQWHMERLRPDGSHVFHDIAYNFVCLNGITNYGDMYLVENDGKIEQGRPETELAGGVLNHHIGTLEICLVGKNNVPTAKQSRALKSFILSKVAQYPSIKQVVGHNWWQDTDCPGFDVGPWLRDNGLERFIPVKGFNA